MTFLQAGLWNALVRGANHDFDPRGLSPWWMGDRTHGNGYATAKFSPADVNAGAFMTGGGLSAVKPEFDDHAISGCALNINGVERLLAQR